jgi:NAD(P)-dependent dehydrogenase (short-subunit alcohol dehydrogenase family)
MSGPLQDRNAVVTGGARGLGRAIAARLAQAGAAITVIDTAPGDLPEAWRVEALDLTAPDAESRLAALATRPTDILVANAGTVPPWRGIADLDMAEWDRVMAVNVRGVAVALKAFAPALARSAHASAIVMASINAERAHPKQALYTASKHAVLGLMRAAALDLGPRGIRVNALAPGPVATEALQARIASRHAGGGPAPAEAFAALAAETALGRIATAAQVADAALFLASDAAAGITGQILPVECGLS